MWNKLGMENQMEGWSYMEGPAQQLWFGVDSLQSSLVALIYSRVQYISAENVLVKSIYEDVLILWQVLRE